MTAPLPAVPGTFEEAIAWAKSRGAVLPAEFYGALQEESRGKAFTVSGLAGLTQIQQTLDSLNTALQMGESFESWQERFGPEVDLPGPHLEVVFRNFMQTAYNAGRWAQFERNKAALPYVQFVAIDDGRTTPICRSLNRTIRPVGDAFWRGHSPPCHHNSILPGNRVCGKVYSALKARYSGPAIEVIGQSGSRFTVTSQHPVLTTRGWVFANDLTERDELICYGGVVNKGPASPDSHKDNSPPTIEEVFEALHRTGSVSTPRSTLNFHGDEVFIQGDVDIVAADSRLMAAYQSFITQHTQQFALSLADHSLGFFKKEGALIKRCFCGVLPGLRQSAFFALVFLGKVFSKGRLPVRDNASLFQRLRKSLVAHAIHSADLFKRNTGLVGLESLYGDLFSQIGTLPPSQFCAAPLRCFLAGSPGDASIVDIPIGTALSNPKAHTDIRNIHSGLIQTDRVLSLRRFDYSGHVYDLHTKAGFIILCNGDNLHCHQIVSNCRSTLRAVSAAQAQRYGGITREVPTEPVPEGWGHKPTGQDAAAGLVQAIANKSHQLPRAWLSVLASFFVGGWSAIATWIGRVFS